MRNFIKLIREKDKVLSRSYTEKELSGIKKVLNDLEEQYRQIRDDLKNIRYLLDLIGKHSVIEVGADETVNKEHENWFDRLRDRLEDYHSVHTGKLSEADVQYLQSEKGRLLMESRQLKEQQKILLSLTAKTRMYLVNTQNAICEELTGGHNVAAVGEKLLEHFGKQISGKITCDQGRKEIVNFIEDFFKISRIQAGKVANILEDRKVIDFKVDLSKIATFPDFEGYSDFSDLTVGPMYGTWYINA